jgi:hypothetical protein
MPGRSHVLRSYSLLTSPYCRLANSTATRNSIASSAASSFMSSAPVGLSRTAPTHPSAASQTLPRAGRPDLVQPVAPAASPLSDSPLLSRALLAVQHTRRHLAPRGKIPAGPAAGEVRWLERPAVLLPSDALSRRRRAGRFLGGPGHLHPDLARCGVWSSANRGHADHRRPAWRFCNH